MEMDADVEISSVTKRSGSGGPYSGSDEGLRARQEPGRRTSAFRRKILRMLCGYSVQFEGCVT